MENLTGTWEGEYSINIGEDENPNIEYHSFRLEINDNNGDIDGTVEDLTLSNESSRISGFHMKKNISFIKKYNRLILAKNGKYFGDDSSEHPDIHYSGNYNEKEQAFEGTWEIHENEERDGLQEAFFDSHFVGKWYMKKNKFNGLGIILD